MSGAEDLDGDLPERRDPNDATVRVLTIINKKGLHARASAKFCQTVERFDAAIRVTRGSETVGGTSIMGLMMLAAGLGSRLRITCEGTDAEKALTEIEAIIQRRFDED